jgi:hypothetical protein
MPEKIKNSIEQKHARILREALGKVYKSAPLEAQKYIHNQLKHYADSVRPYCNCPERWQDPKKKDFICVDCGKRHAENYKD